jgi:hypothetical protein
MSIQYMGGYAIDRFLYAINVHRGGSQIKGKLGQKRQVADMVDVGMSNQYVVYSSTIFRVKYLCNRAAIEKQFVINQECSGS